MGKILIQNAASQIFMTERGDLELRIIGLESYECVARVPFCDQTAVAQGFRQMAVRALKEWFHDSKYCRSYRKKAFSGRNVPSETWTEIRECYGFPFVFDCG